MKNRFCLGVLWVLIMGVSGVAAVDKCGNTARGDRPNIIVILCDDLGYSDVGFNGSTDIRTPELDQLANGGVVCTAGYVVHPFCGPSRMGLMSGRYPHEFGGPFNMPNSGHGIEEWIKLGVPLDETLISTELQDAGYYTGAIGKWHVGHIGPYHPNQRGIDEYYGFLEGGHKYFPEEYKQQYAAQVARGVKHINCYLLPLERNGTDVDETEYMTDALSREASTFINKASKKDQPFYLYLAYNAPHVPLEAKAEDLKLFDDIEDAKRKTYAAMVYAVDRGVGRIVNTLKATGEYENTLIVFLSDNGGKLTEGATNRPLREGKGSALEGGYRVPFFFHWPKMVKEGRTYDHPVSAIDFYPTFAALGMAEVAGEKARNLDGVNVWDAVMNNVAPDRCEPLYVLRHRKGYHDVAIREGDWKASKVGKGAPWKLFKISEDISETTDLSDQHPEILKQLIGSAKDWSETHTEPQWFHIGWEGEEWHADGMPNYEETFE